jgi:hypothetical protein
MASDDSYSVDLKLSPATEEQLDAAAQLCTELKIARDALDRAIEHTRRLIHSNEP